MYISKSVKSGNTKPKLNLNKVKKSYKRSTKLSLYYMFSLKCIIQRLRVVRGCLHEPYIKG